MGRNLRSGPQFLEKRSGLDHAALVLADHDAARLEGALEDFQRLAWFGIAAHEHVEGREALFRPSVDGDVAFRQHRHARDAAAFFAVSFFALVDSLSSLLPADSFTTEPRFVVVIVAEKQGQSERKLKSERQVFVFALGAIG